MTVMLLPAPTSAPALPVVLVSTEAAPSTTSRAGQPAGRPSMGDWAWRLVTVVLGPIADRNPDIALTVLQTADELLETGRAWIGHLTGRPTPACRTGPRREPA